MAFSWRTLRATPRLDSYEEAAAWEAKVKPIRGDEYNRKPLGRRDQKYRHIYRHTATGPLKDAIDIWNGGHPDHPDTAYYRSAPTIRYMPNGDVHIFDQGYNIKAAANELIGAVLGVTTRAEGGKMWATYDGECAPLRATERPRWVARKGWVAPDKDAIVEPNVFRKNERGNWVYVNPPRLTTRVVNRKGAKSVREMYAEGLKYLSAMTKLRRDEAPKWDEVREAFGLTADKYRYEWDGRSIVPWVRGNQFTHEHAAQVVSLLASPDATDQYKAYLWLSWQTNGATETVLKHADEVLMMHHHEKWFTPKEVPEGQKAHDRYAWAVPA